MALSIRTRRLLKIIGGTVAGWVLAAFLTRLLVATDEAPLHVSITLAFGVIAGLLSVWFELRLVPRYLRRITAGRLLLVRTFFYTGMIALVVIILGGMIGVERAGVSLREVYRSQEFRAFLMSGRFLAIIVLFLGASFLINFVRQMSRMLGPGRLLGLFLGRYHHPVEEERLFMFLDLTSSTTLAERLGPLRFNAFKNDFFYDVAEPILATRGEIYQYVGDEVVVTWKVRNGKPTGDALRCFFLISEQIQARRERYLQRYGEAPAFKAGFHGGPVVTAEVGDIKRDIVHSGDAVNTAARIEAQCRSLGRRLLVSEHVLGWLAVPDGWRAVDLGLMPLRGKRAPVRLYGVEGEIEDAL